MTMFISTHEYVVYTHSIDGQVIYVGKGHGARPFIIHGRTPLWRSMVNAAGGFEVTILARFSSQTAALRYERDTIKTMRPICNSRLNGGWTIPEWQQKKMIEARLAKPLSQAQRRSLARGRSLRHKA